MSGRRRHLGHMTDEALQKGLMETMQFGQESASEGRVEHIDVRSIRVNPNNPRKLRDITTENVQRHVAGEINLPGHLDAEGKEQFEYLQNLASAIKTHGLLQNIVVEPLGQGYQIIAGERRFLAHLLLGKSKIRALIRPTSDSGTSFLASLIENEIREGLSFAEYTHAMREIIATFTAKHGFEPELQDIAAMVHKSMSYVSIVKRCAIDENLYEMIQAGKIKGFREARSWIAKQAKADEPPSPPEPRGRPKKYASLGRVTNGKAIQWIAQNLFADAFAGVDWNDNNQVEKAWEAMMKRIEDDISTKIKQASAP